MARGFHRRGRGKGLRYDARLDEGERAVLTELFAQVLALIEPEPRAAATPTGAPGDEFDAIVAGLGSDFGATTGSGADGSVGDPTQEPAVGGRDFGGEPRDPALDRLFPAGNRTDEQAATEFRRLSEPSLRRRKADNLRGAIEVLTRAADDRVELRAEQALAFLVALTDVRLVVGDRLGLREDADAERLDALAALADPGDPAAYAIVVYDFLTWLQETLATSMLPTAKR